VRGLPSQCTCSTLSARLARGWQPVPWGRPAPSHRPRSGANRGKRAEQPAPATERSPACWARGVAGRCGGHGPWGEAVPARTTHVSHGHALGDRRPFTRSRLEPKAVGSGGRSPSGGRGPVGRAGAGGSSRWRSSPGGPPGEAGEPQRTHACKAAAGKRGPSHARPAGRTASPVLRWATLAQVAPAGGGCATCPGRLRGAAVRRAGLWTGVGAGSEGWQL